MIISIHIVNLSLNVEREKKKVEGPLFSLLYQWVTLCKNVRNIT